MHRLDDDMIEIEHAQQQQESRQERHQADVGPVFGQLLEKPLLRNEGAQRHVGILDPVAHDQIILLLEVQRLVIPLGGDTQRARFRAGQRRGEHEAAAAVGEGREAVLPELDQLQRHAQALQLHESSQIIAVPRIHEPDQGMLVPVADQLPLPQIRAVRLRFRYDVIDGLLDEIHFLQIQRPDDGVEHFLGLRGIDELHVHAAVVPVIAGQADQNPVFGQLVFDPVVALAGVREREDIGIVHRQIVQEVRLPAERGLDLVGVQRHHVLVGFGHLLAYDARSGQIVVDQDEQQRNREQAEANGELEAKGAFAGQKYRLRVRDTGMRGMISSGYYRILSTFRLAAHADGAGTCSYSGQNPKRKEAANFFRRSFRAYRLFPGFRPFVKLPLKLFLDPREACRIPLLAVFLDDFRTVLQCGPVEQRLELLVHVRDGGQLRLHRLLIEGEAEGDGMVRAFVELLELRPLLRIFVVPQIILELIAEHPAARVRITGRFRGDAIRIADDVVRFLHVVDAFDAPDEHVQQFLIRIKHVEEHHRPVRILRCPRDCEHRALRIARHRERLGDFHLHEIHSRRHAQLLVLARLERLGDGERFAGLDEVQALIGIRGQVILVEITGLDPFVHLFVELARLLAKRIDGLQLRASTRNAQSRDEGIRVRRRPDAAQLQADDRGDAGLVLLDRIEHRLEIVERLDAVGVEMVLVDQLLVEHETEALGEFLVRRQAVQLAADLGSVDEVIAEHALNVLAVFGHQFFERQELALGHVLRVVEPAGREHEVERLVGQLHQVRLVVP
ncbi:hypothetical protein BN871_BB_00080 [Paenibacillus sp. P22]|nr:hypothetical protein BN871_BB_00080 [Paenibacillus sp. P22]